MLNTVYLMSARYFYTFAVIAYADTDSVIINVRDRKQNDVQVRQKTVSSERARQIFDALRNNGCVAFKDAPRCPHESDEFNWEKCEFCPFAEHVTDPMWQGTRIFCKKYEEWL